MSTSQTASKVKQCIVIAAVREPHLVATQKLNSMRDPWEFYLLFNRVNFPTFPLTPVQAGIQFVDSEEVKGWVDLIDSEWISSTGALRYNKQSAIRIRTRVIRIKNRTCHKLWFLLWRDYYEWFRSKIDAWCQCLHLDLCVVLWPSITGCK